MSILGFFTDRGSAADFANRRRTLARLCDAPQGASVSTGFCVAGPDVAADERFALALDGYPRSGDERLDAAALLRLLRADGTGFVGRLKGSFALAAYDSETRNVLLAIDRIGIGRLTYSSSPNAFFFGTKATAVRELAGGEHGISNQSIYDFFFFHMVPAPNTVFHGIHKLPLAHVVEWSNGSARARQYWKPTFATQTSTNAANLGAELHDLLDKATRRTDPDTSTGAFLSGGLDSSTVAGYLSRVAGGSIDAFSIGFGVSAYDELKYARIAAAAFGCAHHEYNVTPADIVSVFGAVARAYDEPFGNSSAIPTLLCARLAVQAGKNHLLAGDGGDELFGGNERYSKQKKLEAYTRLPAGLRSRVVEPMMSVLAPLSFMPPIRKLRRYVEQARIPLPHRLGANFAFTVGLHDMFSADFMASVNRSRPAVHMGEVYAAVEASAVLDRLLAYDWRLTLADNDLRKVSTMCQLAGIRVSFPMLDDDLVEFSARVPAPQKMKGAELRSFYKEAMRGFLPDEILTKKKHGFGLPFGIWLKTEQPLAELVFSSLSDLNSRRIFKPGFIDEVVAQHRTGPAAYFGYFIWDLAMLEEWLKAYA